MGALGRLWGLRGVLGALLHTWGSGEVPGAPHACQLQAALVDLVWPNSLALSPYFSKHPGGLDKEFLKN